MYRNMLLKLYILILFVKLETTSGQISSFQSFYDDGKLSYEININTESQ